MSEKSVWFNVENVASVLSTFTAFGSRLFKAAFCLDKVDKARGFTVRSLLNNESDEDQVDERQCVFCNESFKENGTPLTASEAKKVRSLCPDHLNTGKRRTFHRVPQNPRHICRDCTSSFRALIQDCHFTVSNPDLLSRNYNSCTRSMKEAGRFHKLVFVEPSGPYKYQEYDMP
ncbi:Hypothetical predicted protein [Cloeon dipterum]|uniref:Uncharacterized protein n=1 Tax=Cloeon dipterum TaxID=197152 RepID=A0A8S1DK17_9INSE|nr:Hypothetical predicted protein [Cloeon dipterum]